MLFIIVINLFVTLRAPLQSQGLMYFICLYSNHCSRKCYLQDSRHCELFQNSLFIWKCIVEQPRRCTGTPITLKPIQQHLPFDDWCRMLPQSITSWWCINFNPLQPYVLTLHILNFGTGMIYVYSINVSHLQRLHRSMTSIWSVLLRFFHEPDHTASQQTWLQDYCTFLHVLRAGRTVMILQVATSYNKSASMDVDGGQGNGVTRVTQPTEVRAGISSWEQRFLILATWLVIS